jgi:hypothetical protein
MKEIPETGTVILDAEKIIGTFQNARVMVCGTTFQVKVDNNRIVLS